MRDEPATGGEQALAVRSLAKTFSGSRALEGVTIGFRRGAITALLGPNGCGKSTLIKLLAGFHAPDAGGGIEIGGVPIATPVDPREAYRRGLRFVHQDLGLVDEMSIADNLAFAHAFDGRATLARLSGRRLRATARAELRRFGLDVDPATRVGDLSRTDQIMVAIARAFHGGGRDEGGRIVILDEPTASLPAGEVDRVLDAVRRMRDEGGTLIYVSHRIDEVLRIADDVVVLRDGSVAAQQRLGDLDAAGLARLITGAAAQRPASERPPADGDVVLELAGLGGDRVRGVDLQVRAGEIVGVAGLAGCGRSELARLLTGVQEPTAGELRLDGRPVRFRDPRAAIDAGVAFVPPERARLGCIPDLSVRHNVALSGLEEWWSKGFLNQRRERGSVQELMERFDVRPRDSERRMAFLSGGNQQKAVIAKFARLSPRVLVIDEPTQGVDIAGKQGIAEVIRAAARAGTAIVIASSDFDEIADLCDRVVVLDRGDVVAVFARGEIHEEQLAVLTAQHQRGG